MKVLGGERLALAGSEGKARCAYCHEDVTGAEPDLVACEHCHTVLHADCYDELGRCPILGCTGTKPERAPKGRDSGLRPSTPSS
ncbi:MAG: RING finger protein [Planctomycetota bacterium]